MNDAKVHITNVIDNLVRLNFYNLKHYTHPLSGDIKTIIQYMY